MSELTTEQFLQKLLRARLKLKEDDTPLRLASYSALSLQTKRIFTDGLKSDGSAIGVYSTKDIWLRYSDDRFPNTGGFVPRRGKQGNTAFKSDPSRVRQTSYFEGWKGLREAQGRPTDHINLDFTGELRSDFENPQGGQPTTRKVSDVEYVSSVRRSLSSKKIQGAEDRFGTIFKLTETERDQFYKTARFELRKLLAEA